MRIIAGIHRGRKLIEPPDRAIRPTLDRIRESMFDLVQFQVPGARVLDVFAGTGALGLEALSRGADTVVFLERNRRSADIVRQNINLLDGHQQCQLVVTNCYEWAAREATETGPFELVFVDPPFAEYRCLGGQRRLKRLLDSLAQPGALAAAGTVVLEAPRETELADLTSQLGLVDQRQYGHNRVGLFKRCG